MLREDSEEIILVDADVEESQPVAIRKVKHEDQGFGVLVPDLNTSRHSLEKLSHFGQL